MTSKKQKHFLKLYQPVHARFEKFCRARAFGDMPYEDLINDSLLIAFKKMEKIKNEKAFLSFLIGISTRILANSKRKKKAINVAEPAIFNQHPDPSNFIEKQFEIELLYQSLAKLPELQKEAIILFEITGFSIKEIMEIQKSGESAIKQRLARGRKELAKIIKYQVEFKLLENETGR
jgi:RNA polymerase sigma-70 factor (ECF subfamily)